MNHVRPDWRWREIEKAVEVEVPPTDAFLQDIYNVIKGDLDHQVYQYALDLHTVHPYRDTMVAWLISGANMDQIVQGSDVIADAVIAFEKLFMDSSAFRNKMEWRSYAEHYVANCCHDSRGEDQVKMAALEGPIPLLIYWKKGNEIIKITDEEILTQQALMAHVKALAARNASVTDPAAKEAFKWGQFAVATAQRRNILNDTSEVEVDAIIAIQRRKATVEAQEIGLDPLSIEH